MADWTEQDEAEYQSLKSDFYSLKEEIMGGQDSSMVCRKHLGILLIG